MCRSVGLSVCLSVGLSACFLSGCADVLFWDAELERFFDLPRLCTRALEFLPSENGLGNSQDSREFQRIPWEFPESRARGLGGCWHPSLEKRILWWRSLQTPIIYHRLPVGQPHVHNWNWACQYQGLYTALYDAKEIPPSGGGLRKEIPVIFSVTSPKDPPCNDLPCMGIPGNSHETAISELGIPIGIPKISGPYRIHVLLYRQGYLLSIVDTLACTVVTEISSITRSREMRCCIPSLFSYISSPSLLSSTLTQIVLGKGINLRFIYVVISFFNG